MRNEMRSVLRFTAPSGQAHAIQSVVVVTEDPRQAALLDLLLQGRPERVNTFLLGIEDEATRQEAGKVADALSTLGLALALEPPSAELRARVLSSLKARQKVHKVCSCSTCSTIT